MFVPHLLVCRDLFGMGYTETHYTEDGRRVTSLPEEVRRLNVVQEPHRSLNKMFKRSFLLTFDKLYVLIKHRE